MSLNRQQVFSEGASPISRGTHAPFAIAGLACLALGALLASQFWSPAIAFEVAGLLVCLIFIPLWWPYGALCVLLTASVMPCFSVEINRWNARPEDFVVLFVLIAFLCRKRAAGSQRPAWMAADFFILGYLAWNFVCSATMSPDPKLTLRWALLNGLVALGYFLVRWFVRGKEAFRRVFKAFIVVGIGECILAVMAFLSWHLWGTSFGVDVGQYASGSSGTYGTQYEPNLLGSYAACLAIILLVLYFLLGRKHRPLLIVTVVVALGAMVVSLARAAFLAFVVVSLVLLFIGLRRGLVRVGRLLPLLVALVMLVIPFWLSAGKNLEARFADLSAGGVQSDADTMGRLLEWALAIEDIQQHPIVGNGTASFQVLANAKQFPILGDRPWVGNSIIRIWHDTGAVGFILFSLAIFTLAKEIRKTLTERTTETAIIIALASGFLVYVIAFMSTDGTMLSFFWVHLGLLAAGVSVLRENQKAAVATTNVS